MFLFNFFKLRQGLCSFLLQREQHFWWTESVYAYSSIYFAIFKILTDSSLPFFSASHWSTSSASFLLLPWRSDSSFWRILLSCSFRIVEAWDPNLLNFVILKIKMSYQDQNGGSLGCQHSWEGSKSRSSFTQLWTLSNKDYMATNENKVVKGSEKGTPVTHRNSNLVLCDKIIID